MRRAPRLLALSVTLLFVTSCTLTIDPDRPQCESTDDCSQSFPRKPYVCSGGYCIQPSCQSDAECREHDGLSTSICKSGRCEEAECTDNGGCGNGACDMESFRCVASQALTCDVGSAKGDSECQRKYGRRVCSRTGLCVDAECTRDDDCGVPRSDTMHCEAGKCRDRQWGCIGTYPPEPPAEARVSWPLQAYKGWFPVPPLTVALCRDGLAGSVCVPPAPGLPAPTYDIATRSIAIPRLPEGLQFRIAIEGPPMPNPDDQIMPVDYYRTLTFRGDEKIVKFDLVTVGLQKLANQLSDGPVQQPDGTVIVRKGVKATDPLKSGLYARVFDCEGNLAPGLTIGVNDVQANLQILYATEQGLPDETSTTTTRMGSAIVGNLMPQKSTKVWVKKGDRVISSFTFYPLASRITVVDLYPYLVN